MRDACLPCHLRSVVCKTASRLSLTSHSSSSSSSLFFFRDLTLDFPSASCARVQYTRLPALAKEETRGKSNEHINSELSAALHAMDPVQELIEGIGPSQLECSGRATPPTAPSAAVRRTKLVFVYSDEDEEDPKHHLTRATTTGATTVAEVSCETHAIPLSEDALAELRADAHAIDDRLDDIAKSADDSAEGDEHGAPGGLFFQEDVLSGLGAVASAPGLTSTLMGHFVSTTARGGLRVREVDAPALWDGAVASSNGTDGVDEATETGAVEVPALLRRGLPAASFVLESRRKRFRDTQGDSARSGREGGEKDEGASSSPAPAAVPKSTSSSAHEGGVRGDDEGADCGGGEDDEVVMVVEEQLDVQPVYDDDGETVRALKTRGGYQLTLDERDLLENDEEVEEAETGAGEDADAVVAAQQAAADEDIGDDDAPNESDRQDDGAQEDWGDLFDDIDEDDEDEEEEIDEAIVVAVVEQLVRCCEADDLDPQMSLEATRFTAAAKPLLKDLTDEVITAKTFGQRIDRDLRRFQRVYRNVYRPRESPIVIDGVVMDM